MTADHHSSGCEHCPSRTNCECPDTPAVCLTGKCVCTEGCPCRVSRRRPPSQRSGCFGWFRLIVWWPFLWLLFLLGVFGLFAVVVQDTELLDTTWLWFILVLFAIFAMLGWMLSLKSLIGVKSSSQQGCAPWLIYGLVVLVALGFATAGLWWLVSNGDSAGARWTLLPIAILAILIALGGLWYLRDHRIQPSGSDIAPLLPGVFLAIIFGTMIFALIWWFLGGTLSGDTTDVSGPAVTTESPTATTSPPPVVSSSSVKTDDDQPPQQNEDSAIASSSTSSTPPVVASTSSTSEVLPFTPLPPAVLEILELYCGSIEGVEADLVSMETLLAEPILQSGPVEGEFPELADSPPAGLDIEYIGVASAGCRDSPQTLVIAELSGSLQGIQISMAIDIVGQEGFEADPDALAAVGRTADWNRFVSVDIGEGGASSSVSQFDHQFNAREVTTLFEQRGDIVAFIVERAADETDIRFIFQTFFRDGDTAEDDIAWNAAIVDYTHR